MTTNKFAMSILKLANKNTITRDGDTFKIQTESVCYDVHINPSFDGAQLHVIGRAKVDGVKTSRTWWMETLRGDDYAIATTLKSRLRDAAESQRERREAKLTAMMKSDLPV